MRREYLEIHVRHQYWRDSMGREGQFEYLPGWGSSPGTLLNTLGEQGWELAGVAGSQGEQEYRLFLKRPKP